MTGGFQRTLRDMPKTRQADRETGLEHPFLRDLTESRQADREMALEHTFRVIFTRFD